MFIKRLLKVSLSVLLLAAGASAYAAEGDKEIVTLRDGQTKVTWQHFVDVINGTIILEGAVSQEVLDAWIEAQRVYQEYLDEAQRTGEAYTGAQRDYSSAFNESSNASRALTSYNSALNLAILEQGALRDQRDEKLQLANEKKAEVDAFETERNTRIGEKQAEIDKLQAQIDAIDKDIAALSEPTTRTQPWLTQLKEDYLIFKDAFKNKPTADAQDITVYYDFYYDEDDELEILILSLVPRPNLTQSMGAKELYQEIVQNHTSKKSQTDFVAVDDIWFFVNEEYPNDYIYVGAVKVNQILTTLNRTLPNGINDSDYQETYTPEPAPEKVAEYEAEQGRLRSEMSSYSESIAAIRAEVNPYQEDYNSLHQEYTDLVSQISEYNTTIAGIKEEMQPVQETVDRYTQKDDDGNTELDRLLKDQFDKEDAKNAADQAVVDATPAYEEAKATYEKAVENSNIEAIEPYKRVTLTDDVTTDAYIKSYDGTIVGNKNGKPAIITYTGNSELFETFTGNLTKIGVNGTFAAASSGMRNNVANWTGSAGVFYDTDNNRFNSTSLPQLGHMAREVFGVDFSTEQLVELTDATKVYSITVYSPSTEANPFFAQLRGTDFFLSDNTTLKKDANTLIKSEDKPDYDIDNVYYNDGLKNICPNMVITDRESFYAPEEIYAENLSYNRTFKKGQNAVCLPFRVEYADDDDNISGLCTYEMETEEKFWFIRKAESVKANTPMLLIAKQDFAFGNLKGVTIQATPEDQICLTKSESDPSIAFGTFKKAGRDEFYGAHAAAGNKIYALSTVNNETKFRAAASSVEFPAFRMVIYSNEASNATPELAARYAIRSIGILDEKGIEITDEVTTGIDAADVAQPSLNIVGGQGEIHFISDSDFGKVQVYSLDGRLITVADVVEGTTTVNVTNGLYIVNGKKILVK